MKIQAKAKINEQGNEKIQPKKLDYQAPTLMILEPAFLTGTKEGTHGAQGWVEGPSSQTRSSAPPTPCLIAFKPCPLVYRFCHDDWKQSVWRDSA